MIQNKKDLSDYLEADRISLGRTTKRPKLQDIIWKYEIALRKAEYYTNVKNIFLGGIVKRFYKLKLFFLGIICNYSISINCIDKGLSLAHVGTVVISSHAKIGKNCRIHAGVNIGTSAGTTGQAPIIGNNVYIGPGAKIFGPIKIGDDVAIGANAVVNKSFSENHVTLAGIPAKIINYKGSDGFLFK